MRKSTIWMLILGLALISVPVAQANAAGITINSGASGEPSLWTIADGWGFTSVTQANLESATTQQTMAAGSYMVIDLARYAADDNDGGFYTGIGTVPAHGASVSSISGTAVVDPAPNGYNSAVSIAFKPTATFGFYNNDETTGYLGATQNQNTGAGLQSNGYIFNLASINAAYAGYYLVAFEDGDSHPPLNDMDYNDLVFVVKDAPTVPVPPSLLLFGSGLLGLVGWRGFRKV